MNVINSAQIKAPRRLIENNRLPSDSDLARNNNLLLISTRKPFYEFIVAGCFYRVIFYGRVGVFIQLFAIDK